MTYYLATEFKLDFLNLKTGNVYVDTDLNLDAIRALLKVQKFVYVGDLKYKDVLKELLGVDIKEGVKDIKMISTDTVIYIDLSKIDPKKKYEKKELERFLKEGKIKIYLIRRA